MELDDNGCDVVDNAVFLRQPALVRLIHKLREAACRQGSERARISAMRGCHVEGSSCGTTFWDILKSSGSTKLILWPETQAVAAKRASDRQACRDALENLPQ
eukprot:364994-Chlamydomonas_euryale.AAC.4